MAANVWDDVPGYTVELGGLERLSLLVDLHSDSFNDDGVTTESEDSAQVKRLKHHTQQVKLRNEVSHSVT
jgi:hypothetical protein